MTAEFPISQNSWITRHSLWVVATVPGLAQLVGSAFNISYNVLQIRSILTEQQLDAFTNSILVYNCTVYPAAVTAWLVIVFSMQHAFQRRLRGEPVDPQRLSRARRRAINLPWWGVSLAAVGWMMCIPIFLLVLGNTRDPLNPAVYWHLPISVTISALIALTHGFFLVELTTARLLFPVLFDEGRPLTVPGAITVSIEARGILWALSAGVCPIVSLLLLYLAPQGSDGGASGRIPLFAASVGIVGIVFGLVTASMLGRLVVRPIKVLEQTANAVAHGDLTARVDLLRADEFGPLIDEFNHMIATMREKERLQDTFGRHVGRRAATQILARDPGLGGIEDDLTVLFADLRGFTARSAQSTPQQVVNVLNAFFTQMVDIIEEQNAGMVNKFLGDGFMAIFGAGENRSDHAAVAVGAGRDMLSSLKKLNKMLAIEGLPPLEMGIGIHTGRAILGSIGSPRRLEYTAIGDTVNIASRMESLTERLGHPLLITASTYECLVDRSIATSLPPQQVKGQPHPIQVYRVNDQD